MRKYIRPLGYIKLFKASRLITKVKQRLTCFHSDEGHRTRWVSHELIIMLKIN